MLNNTPATRLFTQAEGCTKPGVAQVARLKALGAVPWDHQQERGFDFWVMRDPWGNEFCVLQVEFPDLLARRRPWTE
jgi:Glyoxalase-like domain